jgi:hypothetical protein
VQADRAYYTSNYRTAVRGMMGINLLCPLLQHFLHQWSKKYDRNIYISPMISYAMSNTPSLSGSGPILCIKTVHLLDSLAQYTYKNKREATFASYRSEICSSALLKWRLTHAREKYGDFIYLLNG